LVGRIQHPGQLNGEDKVKTLDLCWQPTLDKFTIANNKKSVALTEDISKRTVAAVIAPVFDPLGLISPSVTPYKILLQELWLHILSWDDTLPTELLEKWQQIFKQLDSNGRFEIHRFVLLQGAINIQVHGFADGSERAYETCVYLRSVDHRGEVKSHLLCSLSRVASVKKVTLPTRKCAERYCWQTHLTRFYQC
jgi:hypothetical protein